MTKTEKIEELKRQGYEYVKGQGWFYVSNPRKDTDGQKKVQRIFAGKNADVAYADLIYEEYPLSNWS